MELNSKAARLRADEIFFASLDIDSAKARREFIEHVCAGDCAVAKEVKALL